MLYVRRFLFGVFAIGALAIGLPFAAMPLLLSDVVIERALAQGIQFGPGGIIVGKVNKQGPPPVCTNCTITGGSTDSLGQVTATVNTTNVVITFASAWNTAPMCVLNVGGRSSVGLNWAVTTTAITITSTVAGGQGFAASDKINYICAGYNN